MSHRFSGLINSRIRLISFVIGLVLLSFAAALTLPPGSRARVEEQSAASTVKRRRPEFVPGEILVRYQTEAVAKQKRSSSALKVEGRSIQIGVERFEGSDLVPGLRMARVVNQDTLAAVAALNEQPDVLYAQPNYIMHADLNPNDPSFGSLYGLTKIGAPTAWNTTTGSNNVVVGVIDEGIDINHPDLQANIFNNPAPGSIPGISGDLHGYDFVNNSGTIPAGDHATHTSGTVGAVGNNGVGVVGVNWQVKLMSLKFLGAGGGSDSDAVRAYSYAKQMRDLFVSSGGSQGANIRVLNNSYGGGGFSQASLDAIRALNTSGILFVASDGNDGIDSDILAHYPSGYDSPNLISVSATDSADNLASFSNYGAQTATLGAPGVGILSTIATATNPGNPYGSFSGTSMSSPHVAGAAALLWAQNPNLTVQQVKSLLIFNGDPVASLNGKTLTGRRLNVATSMQTLAGNDTTPPGIVTGLNVTSQSGRTINLGWTASGDDGAAGTASLYQLSFVDSVSGVSVPLKSLVPPTSGTAQTLSVKVPYGHTRGSVKLSEFDNVGNEGTPASVNVTVSFADGNPYAKTVGPNAALSTFGTHRNFNCDDCYQENVALPFPFPFFGQNYSTVALSSNGNIYFAGHSAHDVPSSVGELTNFRMISGLWDDLDLRTSSRADADVYMVQPDANRVIFRWQAVPCNDEGFGCTGGGDINFEIELRSDGTIQSRYGSGNTALFPVVGISGGEPEPYVITSHTSEVSPKNLTNAQTVTYIPRTVLNPVDNANFFVSQHYRDFLSREPDSAGLAFWSDQITGNASNTPAPCPPGDTVCVNTRRINVSDAFFVELEYQQTGSYVYRVYRTAFGNTQPFPNPHPDPNYQGEDLKMPAYPAFAADRALVVGGSNLAQLQLNFANTFVQHPEFLTRYPASLATADQFVDAVLATIQNDLQVNLSSQRTALINLYNSSGRGGVIYRLADDNINTNPIDNRSLIDAEYNRAFVYTEYGGYLRRNSDIPGFVFWLGQVNSGPLRDITKQHAMVCSFLTSTEYQQRFSSIVSHNNTECN
ncbi:MAG TPA: S8 family serine peptidase [Pyrinomonadaceae bacterium]|nr:S8 family serine peptidase [Pyrinomonadaceae bacterium]